MDGDQDVQIEKRREARETVQVPVSFALNEVLASESSYLNDISASGASFNAMVALPPGTVILLRLPPSRPVFRAQARVVRCQKLVFEYIVGVEFLNHDEAFRRQIVHLVQRIDAYRREAIQAGRALSPQMATVEWFNRFGREFFNT
jgi:c-di-GMP-binding flagellar brake protein YcgR